MKHDRTHCGALSRPYGSHALNSCCHVRKDECLRWTEECPTDMQKNYKLRQTFQASSGGNCPCEVSFLRWKGLSMRGDVEVGLSLQGVVLQMRLSMQGNVEVGLSLQGVVLQMGLSMQGDVEVGLSLLGVVLQMRLPLQGVVEVGLSLQ